MIRDFTNTVKRSDQFKIDVCNLIHLTLNLTYLSIPPISFLEGQRELRKIEMKLELPEEYQLLEVNWKSWN